jgi:hypothetical protein
MLLSVWRLEYLPWDLLGAARPPTVVGQQRSMCKLQCDQRAWAASGIGSSSNAFMPWRLMSGSEALHTLFASRVRQHAAAGECVSAEAKCAFAIIPYT